MATRNSEAAVAPKPEAGEMPVVVDSPSDKENCSPRHRRKVIKRTADLRTMNVLKSPKEHFHHRVSFRAPSGAVIELTASNHSMFKDKYFQKSHRDYRNYWRMDKCWAGIKVTMPDVKQPAATSGRGIVQDRKGGSYKLGAVYTVVTDVQSLYWAFQDPDYIKAMATELVTRAEDGWIKKNEMRVSGARVTHEERHCLSVQTPDMCGNKFHTFLLMIGSSWHFTHETQWETGDVRFNTRKARIQFKYASQNFGTKTNLKDGACFILYPDFMALASSETMQSWLDMVSSEKMIKLRPKHLERLNAFKQSAEFHAAADGIVNQPDSDVSEDEDDDADGCGAGAAGALSWEEPAGGSGKRSHYPGTGGGSQRKKARE